MKPNGSQSQNDTRQKPNGAQGPSNSRRRQAEIAVAGEEQKPQNAGSSTAETARKQLPPHEQPADPLLEENAVDEAGWESFPASDPPAIGGSKPQQR